MSEPVPQHTVDVSVTRPSARIVSIQRWSIVLLVAGGALNYIDRATLSVANKLIQDELGIPVASIGPTRLRSLKKLRKLLS